MAKGQEDHSPAAHRGRIVTRLMSSCLRRECDGESVDGKSTFRRHADMVDDRKVLAQNVKAAKKALDLSQEALALEADIDRTYISGIERGLRNPSLDLIVKLAANLKTTPAGLLTPPLGFCTDAFS